MNKEIINSKLDFISECVSILHQYNKPEIEHAINYTIDEIRKQLLISTDNIDKIPLKEWREKTFREIGTNRFELRTNTSLVYGMDEISKMYDSF